MRNPAGGRARVLRRAFAAQYVVRISKGIGSGAMQLF